MLERIFTVNAQEKPRVRLLTVPGAAVVCTARAQRRPGFVNVTEWERL